MVEGENGVMGFYDESANQFYRTNHPPRQLSLVLNVGGLGNVTKRNNKINIGHVLS